MPSSCGKFNMAVFATSEKTRLSIYMQLSATFSLKRFFSTVLPPTGPFNPHVFSSIVFLTTVFPTADWVPLTRNSIPAGFDMTVFFITRLPVAKILIRIPARMLADTRLSLDGVVDAREHEDANAIPCERVLP